MKKIIGWFFPEDIKELKRIIQISHPDERNKALEELAQEAGVSKARSVDSYTGRMEENIIIERIQQMFLIKQSQKAWLVALASACASVISAIAAWAAIFRN